MWFFDAKSSREGENPELRLVFFRLARLLALPILPLFVFDGKQRPSWKRNKEISRKPHWMVQGCKDMILAFGFEWKQVRWVSTDDPRYRCHYDVHFVLKLSGHEILSRHQERQRRS